MIRKSLSDRLRITIPSPIPDNKIHLRTRVTTKSTETVGDSVEVEVARMTDGISTAIGNSNIMGDVIAVKDGSFGNPIMSIGSYDTALNAGAFSMDLITLHREEILSVYHSSWIFRRIIDKMSQDMWSSGIDIQGDTDPQELTRIYKRLGKLSDGLIYATAQCRLFGGAATLIMVDDGEQDLSKPLDLSEIKKGSRIRLETTDRWWGLTPSQELVTNFRNIDYGTPKYYTFDFYNGDISNSTRGLKVHHSRVLRWVNRKTSRYLNTVLMGWGLSELEHLYQDILGHETTKNAINSLLNKSLLEIVKVKGMRSLMSGLAGGNANEQIRLTGALAGLNTYRSINSLVLLDTDDEYSRYEYSFSGLSDILETQKDTLAGGAEMPKVLLYGDTKGGLTSDSPAELVFYDQTIKGKQEQICRPQLNKLLPILFAVEGIQMPKNLDFEFVSLISTGPEQKLNQLNSVISAVTSLMDAGLITHETALQEIKQVQKQTDFGSNIQQRDIDLAKENDQAERENPSDDESLDENNPYNDTQNEATNTNDYKELQDQVIKKSSRFTDMFKRRKK